MSSIWGKNLKVSIFGESHAKAIGVTIHNLPAGIKIDMEKVRLFLKRRSPGWDEFSTSRKEEDNPEVICGLLDNKTTGAPLTAVIYNKDTRSKDYNEIAHFPRPSHADYTAHIKYGDNNDKRGGGHFSGRITACLVFAGAVCAQILEGYSIYCGSHIKSIKDILDSDFDLTNINIELLNELKRNDFPVIDPDAQKKMKDLIIETKQNGDSVGGVVECVVIGVETGIGSPVFEGVENIISSIMFGIPGVKGVEFGKGFDITKMYGSEANDEMYIENDEVKTYTNNSGGINGGITNGMPIVFKVAIKPTPSIAKEQRTINLESGQNSVIKIQGRHDPCIVKRATPVVEAAANVAILDMILGEGR